MALVLYAEERFTGHPMPPVPVAALTASVRDEALCTMSPEVALKVSGTAGPVGVVLRAVSVSVLVLSVS